MELRLIVAVRFLWKVFSKIKGILIYDIKNQDAKSIVFIIVYLTNNMNNKIKFSLKVFFFSTKLP